jgi:iron complex outermembrane receptor protein
MLPVTLLLSGQTKNGLITGKVTDQNNMPMSYATIKLDGTVIGTLSNEQGTYLLKAPAGSYTLICKSIGYSDVSVPVTISESIKKTIDFRMTEKAKDLNEVIISAVKVKSASATRTLMEVQDIPQAIVVLGQKTIEQQGAFDLTTLTRNMTGINFTGNYSGAGSYQFFNARGFDMVNSQNFRWNGMMIWNLGNNYDDNIEQVEFLKGPTSILFGDVSPGGVLNLVTKKPLADFYLKTEIKAGQWNLFRPSVDMSGPLTKNKKIRYRLSSSYETSNSFRDFVKSERLLIAPSLAWDITPRLSISADFVFKKSSATDDAGLVSPDGTTAGLIKLSPSLYLGEPAMKYLFSDQNYFANLTYRISENWRFKAVGFHSYTENRPFGLWPEQPDENGNLIRNVYGYNQWLANNSASADILGSFYTGSFKHNLLAGFEFQETHFRYTNEGYLNYFDTNNIYHMVYGVTPVVEPSNKTYLPFVSKINRAGIYFQDQVMMLNEKLHLLLGFRYGKTQQGNHYYQNELPGTDYEGYTDDIVSKNVFTPRIGVVYKPLISLSLYASYSKGYEINSPDIFALNYSEYSTPPATISTQYEFGAKGDLFDNGLGATLSFFEINKLHPYGYVYADPVNPNYDEYNVYYEGHHRSKGIELDIDGKILPSVSLTLGAAYTQTEVVEDPGYPTGNRLPNAPKYAGNIWINYEPVEKLKGFSSGLGFYYKDKFFSGIDNNPDYVVPAGYTMDLSVGYKYKKIGAQLVVSNLTNQINFNNPWVYNLFEVRPLRRSVITLTYKLGK